MRIFWSLIGLDLRGIQREGLAVVVITITLVGFVIVRLGGVYQAELGVAPLLPIASIGVLTLLAIALGVAVGFLMVEEKDSGVREVLAVTPVQPAVMLLYRGVFAFVATLVAAPVGILVIDVVTLPFVAWAALVVVLALLTPTVGLAIPSLARNKVEAFVLFRVASVILMAPLIAFALGEDWTRYLFLISPVGFVIEAYRAFLVADDATATLWAAGGAVYSALLLAAAAVHFQRVVYRMNR